MQFLHTYRRLIIGLLVILAVGALGYFGYQHFRPLPVMTEFKSRFYTFSYPRTLDSFEYAPGVVSVGVKGTVGLSPYAEVTRYQSDPDAATPKDFGVFMKKQAQALCGTDASEESITCTDVTAVPYTNPLGFIGQKLELTLVRKNLTTGTTTNSTYGPVYVFNTTLPGTAEDPLRYSAIFIYPSFDAFLQETTPKDLINNIVSSFSLPRPASQVTF